VTPVTPETRVLLLAPTRKDATNTTTILEKAGIGTSVCGDVDELCRELKVGAGAVIVTDESLNVDPIAKLQAVLRGQPTWSDIPFIALVRGGAGSPAAARAMQTLGNLILLERPVHLPMFVTAMRTALRERARQYHTRRLLSELRDADRRKDVFLAMLAHELRNPLAPIRNASEILRRIGSGNERIEAAGDLIERQVAHLARLVDDLLDVSRMTQGKIQLRCERLDLAPMLMRAVETSSPLIRAKRQQLRVSVQHRTVLVEGDPMRLSQVVANLLNNASKYTPEGGRIGISLRTVRDRVFLSVHDSGVGIPPDMLSAVFELFTQVETSLDRAQGGLGIGLTLVRTIVEMHGGGVRASSRGPGRGSRFTVWLPAVSQLPSMPEASADAASAAPTEEHRVLLVDDNVDAVESLAMLLAIDGHEVRTCYDGPSALAIAASFLPELIVLDVGLPGMNGYQVAERIRQSPELGDPILVALTGYGQEEDRRRAWSAGFDYHLIKPTDVRALEELLR